MTGTLLLDCRVFQRFLLLPAHSRPGGRPRRRRRRDCDSSSERCPAFPHRAADSRPSAFQTATGSRCALSETPAAAPRRPSQPLASRPELIACRSASRTKTRLLLRAKRARRSPCHSAGRFPADAVSDLPSAGSPPAGAVLPQPDAGHSSTEPALVRA